MMRLNEKQKATLDSAKRYFEEGLYDKATPLLNSLVAQKTHSPDVFHMLGTIHYEQGQFKASIRSFKKALEINPDFTDSSIGLSVVLNDLGKYEQAQQIFKTAQDRLKNKTSPKKTDNLTLRIAQKHRELADLYKQNKQEQKAFDNLVTFESLTQENFETNMEKARLLRAVSNFKMASETLKSWLLKSDDTPSVELFIELTELYYLDRQPLSALSSCEAGLKLFPENHDLRNLYKNLKNTTFDLRQQEITV